MARGLIVFYHPSRRQMHSSAAWAEEAHWPAAGRATFVAIDRIYAQRACDAA